MLEIVSEILKTSSTKLAEKWIEKSVSVIDWRKQFECLEALRQSLPQSEGKRSEINILTQYLWGVPVDPFAARAILNIGRDEVRLARAYFRGKNHIHWKGAEPTKIVKRPLMLYALATLAIIAIVALFFVSLLPLLMATGVTQPKASMPSLVALLVYLLTVGYILFWGAVKPLIRVWDADFFVSSIRQNI